MSVSIDGKNPAGIRTLGIIGAGQMGSGIAQIAAEKGVMVILNDMKTEFCSRALENIKDVTEKRIAKGKATQEQLDTILSHIRLSVNMEDLSLCDMVIEAVPENMEIKKNVFSKLSEICREDAILCTNTSSFSITEIVSVCRNPKRCAGMHFFFPAAVMKLVEIIRGKETGDETVAAVKNFAGFIGKTAVECKTDTAGFIVNRCLFAFLLEAIHCYDDGVATVDDIDTAIKLGLNHPMGPFELMDMSGLDTFIPAIERMASLPVTNWTVSDTVKQLVADGNYGRKSGSGWKRYDGRKQG